MFERCPKCGRRPPRSNEANAFYWAMLHQIAERATPKGISYTPDTWHLYFKGRFLGCHDVRMPNGSVHVMPRSTTGMDKDEFSDYCMKIEAWAAEHGIQLDEARS